jgi:peptide/nickel transport system substrate-binding protein
VREGVPLGRRIPVSRDGLLDLLTIGLSRRGTCQQQNNSSGNQKPGHADSFFHHAEIKRLPASMGDGARDGKRHATVDFSHPNHTIADGGTTRKAPGRQRCASCRPWRPQPGILALLASGFTPIYPCHLSQRDMRRSPIGTGPFKFVEYRGNEGIKVTRNQNYWKPGRPYLDGIEYTIIANRSTAILAFVTGKFDMFFPYELTVPLVAEVKQQMPDAVCDISPMNVAANVVMNPVPPFDDLDVRRAVAMALDRKSFVDILTQGQGDIGTAMLPLPAGRWGMPEAMRRELPGYDPDVARSREKARAIMAAHGYGPDKRIKLKLSTRNLPTYRDASVILISQLKDIFIDAEMELVETENWVPRLIRRDYQMALSQVGNGVDDPDQNYPENYACGSRTYMDYCNKEIDALIARQSAEPDQQKRKEIAWEIDRKLTQDAVRPMIYYMRGGTCWRPEVKNVTVMVNSIFNGWRMEDVRLDR